MNFQSTCFPPRFISRPIYGVFYLDCVLSWALKHPLTHMHQVKWKWQHCFAHHGTSTLHFFSLWLGTPDFSRSKKRLPQTLTPIPSPFSLSLIFVYGLSPARLAASGPDKASLEVVCLWAGDGRIFWWGVSGFCGALGLLMKSQGDKACLSTEKQTWPQSPLKC